MWTPSKIESRSVPLDLSVSGQGLRTVRQLLCDEIIICNAVESIDWTEHSIQFELCEACLIDGCNSGGRVAFRHFDERALIIPDFPSITQGDWEATEYAPPRWMLKHGPLAFSHSDWSLFQAACPGAPSFDVIPQASTAELLRLYHFLAPRSFLADFLSPSLARWDLILCTNGPNPQTDLIHLRRLFSDPSNFAGHEICVPGSDSYTVSAFLDLPTVAEWPLFSSESEPAVRLSNGMHFRPKRMA